VLGGCVTAEAPRKVPQEPARQHQRMSTARMVACPPSGTVAALPSRAPGRQPRVQGSSLVGAATGWRDLDTSAETVDTTAAARPADLGAWSQ
jgi:hypothetical protein